MPFVLNANRVCFTTLIIVYCSVHEERHLIYLLIHVPPAMPHVELVQELIHKVVQLASTDYFNKLRAASQAAILTSIRML